MSGTDKATDTITVLDNTELSTIIFVRDYMQFVFEGDKPINCTFTAFTLPVVCVEGLAYQPLAAGYRDAVCTLIGHRVHKAEVTEGFEIRITFDLDRWLLISLKDDDSAGPEAAMLDDGQGVSVW